VAHSLRHVRGAAQLHPQCKAVRRRAAPPPEAYRRLLFGTMSRIAIYEDDDLMRALLREWLSEAGYGVREVGPHAAQRAGTDDLVIASISMPKQAGAQLREVQAAHPGAPLIAISGQFRSGLSTAGTTAQMLGVQRVLAKPLTRGDLLEAVRAIIGAPT
jgi:CheY-like chemotaxis protein